jgi:hypothetical protein
VFEPSIFIQTYYLHYPAPHLQLALVPLCKHGSDLVVAEAAQHVQHIVRLCRHKAVAAAVNIGEIHALATIEMWQVKLHAAHSIRCARTQTAVWASGVQATPPQIHRNRSARTVDGQKIVLLQTKIVRNQCCKTFNKPEMSCMSPYSMPLCTILT